MTQKNVQAQFQLLDSYVKDFSIHTSKKIEDKENLNVDGQLGFRLVNIREENNKMIGQIELINDIKAMIKDEEIVNIHISTAGLFACENNIERELFEEMLKINGATTLSHITRAYIYSVTGLSGIPQIITPMVNFVEFFKNAKEIQD